MITSWTAPGTGATINELFLKFGEWPRYIDLETPITARTNLALRDGVMEQYDKKRLHSENLEAVLLLI